MKLFIVRWLGSRAIARLCCHLTNIRFGKKFQTVADDLGAFPEDQRLQIDELFIETQPAHLQKSSQQKLNAEERDHLRAQIIRERLKLFPKPDISKMARQSDGDSIVVPSNDE